jgi:hypothetical protein
MKRVLIKWGQAASETGKKQRRSILALWFFPPRKFERKRKTWEK